MSVNVGKVIDDARRLAQDPDPSPRTSDAECFAWLNEGLELFQMLNEYLNIVDDRHVITISDPRQRYAATLPLSQRTPIRHVRVLSSRVSSIAARSNRVTRVSLSLLQREDPQWYAGEADTPETVVVHECIDNADKLAFWVYPTPVAGVALDIQAQVKIPAITSKNNIIDIPGAYGGALTDYLTYRLFAQDASDTENQAAGQDYYTKAIEAVKVMQLKDSGEA